MVVLLAFILGVSEGLVIVLARNQLGYAYSNEQEVALYTSRLMPILSASTLFDCLQCVLSGMHLVILRCTFNKYALEGLLDWEGVVC